MSDKKSSVRSSGPSISLFKGLLGLLGLLGCIKYRHVVYRTELKMIIMPTYLKLFKRLVCFVDSVFCQIRYNS